ncbi:MAG: hypothetical protein PWQ96_1405 [Clostridia bacterium]|nr:hypothetical protein [Clostridia bacterium]
MLVKKIDFPVQNLHDLMEEILPELAHQNTNKFNLKIITNLLKTLKIHHPGTYQHSLNVARLSAWLARELGLPQTEIFEIAIGALIHDIGKIKIASSILDKPSKLTDEEWQIIKKHPQIGIHLLAEYNWAHNLYPMIAYHHERVDGNGYLRLTGEEIPLCAKIICIADAFDAMYSTRPYRPKLTLTQCLHEIKKNSGTQFDQDLVEPFISITAKI